MERKFSIGRNRFVGFAKGNLQYNPANSIYRIAEKQYETIGLANEHAAEPNYKDWIDLFCYNSFGDITPTFHSGDPGDYPVGDISNISFNGLSDKFRILTRDEWDFLLFQRDNAAGLFGFAAIKLNEDTTINGFILLPDGECPDTFKHSHQMIIDTDPDLENYFFYNTRKFYSEGFGENIYTKEEFEALESTGAIFFPAGGVVRISEKSEREDKIRVASVNTFASYWTATEYCTKEAAYWITANYHKELLTTAYNKAVGLSVRLAFDL